MRFVSTLSDDLIAQYCQSSLAHWGSGRTLPEYVQRNLDHQARGRGLLRFSGLVDDAGRLLASLKRYTVTLFHPQATPLRTLGIGAVFTQEAARNTGAASRLLRLVLEEAQREGFGASLLFSDIAPSFYERLGFVAYPSIDRSFSATAPLPPKSPNARDERLGYLSSEPAVALTTRDFTAADEAFCYQSSLRARRADTAHLAPTLDEWRFFRWRNSQNPCLILQRGSVDVGHVIVEIDGDALWVEEWAAPHLDDDVMRLTLQHLAATVGRSTIKGWFPESNGLAMTETARPDAIPMLAFFNKDLTPPTASFWSIEHF